MSKKYRLKINYSEITEENIINVSKLVSSELNGELCIHKDNHYIFDVCHIPWSYIPKSWLTEIKGPLSFDEWDKSCPSVVPSSLNYQIPQSELDKFVDLHRRLGWNACLENQKLEKEIKPSCPLYVDYEKSCSAFKERIKELEK